MTTTTPRTAPVRVDVYGCAVVAVGSEVDVRCLQEQGGLLSAKREGYVVTDLQTGTIYAPEWAYESHLATTDQPPRWPLKERSGLITRRHFRGRVLSCRVLSVRYQAVVQITTLIVEPLEERAYR